MSQNGYSESGLGNGELRVLHYYNRMPVDEKGLTFFLFLAVFFVSGLVWWTGESILLAVGAFGLLLLPLWRSLVPIHFEINSEGIARWNFGRRRLILWDSIGSYEIYPKGVLLLPNRVRFPLDPFHGVYIPVPSELEAELKYRLRFFVDKTVDP